jgi:GntR family transcriptional regulator
MADPLYRRIADDLRDQIDSGKLAAGKQLPTELELKDKYSASRNTVRDAIKWVISLGLVETRPGQGTFVVEKRNPYVTTLTADPAKGAGGDEVFDYKLEVSKQHRQPSNADPQVEMQKANGKIAEQLGLPENTQVISRHQRRFIDGTPWSMQTSFYPRGLAAKGADRLSDVDDIEGGAVQYLASTLGLKQVGYRDLITVRTPDIREAEFFKLPEDGRVAVFEVFRTGFDQTGTPMRLTVTVFPTDRNQFQVNVGDVPQPPSSEGSQQS